MRSSLHVPVILVLTPSSKSSDSYVYKVRACDTTIVRTSGYVLLEYPGNSVRTLLYVLLEYVPVRAETVVRTDDDSTAACEVHVSGVGLRACRLDLAS